MNRSALRLPTLAALSAITAIAAGCSPKAPPTPVAEQQTPVEAPMVTAPTGQELNEAIQQPIDRAKAVEGDVMKAKDDMVVALTPDRVYACLSSDPMNTSASAAAVVRSRLVLTCNVKLSVAGLAFATLTPCFAIRATHASVDVPTSCS